MATMRRKMRTKSSRKAHSATTALTTGRLLVDRLCGDDVKIQRQYLLLMDLGGVTQRDSTSMA